MNQTQTGLHRAQTIRSYISVFFDWGSEEKPPERLTSLAAGGGWVGP